MSDQETNAGVDDGKNEQDNNDNKGAITEDASEPTERRRGEFGSAAVQGEAEAA